MKKDDCIFCKIANGEILSTTLYEDEEFRVILDLNPATKGHALILPKNHYTDLFTLDEDIGAKVLPLAKKLGEIMKQSLGCDGFNIVQNNGKAAGQSVLHFHMHIIPRYIGGSDMLTWEPKTASAEDLADVLRKVKEVLDIGQKYKS